MGYHGTVTPKVILRNVLENPGWYTAYTPYQAEVSQGRLEALLNFQQMVIDLTGARDRQRLAARRRHRRGRGDGDGASAWSKTRPNMFFVDRDTHPQTIGVHRDARAAPSASRSIVGDPARDLEAGDGCSPRCCPIPARRARCATIAPRSTALHEAGALAIVATDLLALALLTPPGELGADIAVGSSQRFGVPMGYGGPHAGLLRDAR